MSTLKQKTKVLLKTAKAFVFGEDRRTILVHILLGSGGQKRCVTEEVKKKRSLNFEKKW